MSKAMQLRALTGQCIKTSDHVITIHSVSSKRGFVPVCKCQVDGELRFLKVNDPILFPLVQEG